MAHNPELDHEFRQDKPQEKRYICTSADMGAMSNAGFKRHDHNGKFMGDMAADNVEKNGLKWPIPTVIGLVALIALLVFIWFFANANSPMPRP